MDEQTAKRVVVAAWEADGGCYHCSGSVLEKMKTFYPDIDWDRLNEEFRDVDYKPGRVLRQWLDE